MWRDRWVVLASSDNHDIGDVLTDQDVVRLPWVLTHHSRSAFTSAPQTETTGLALTVDAVVDSSYALPSFVAGTKRLAIVPERLPSSIPMGALKALELPHGERSHRVRDLVASLPRR